MKTLKALMLGLLLASGAAMAGGGMTEAELPTKLEVGGDVKMTGNACPEKATAISRDMNASFNTDHLYFFHYNFAVRDRVRGSKMPRQFTCTVTATLHYEPGYRFSFAEGMTNGTMTAAAIDTVEVKTRYTFPQGGAFNLRSSVDGPYHDEFWQKKSSRAGSSFLSDCSGKAVVAITKEINFDTPAMRPGDEQNGPGDDKDDISMAFIDRDEMNLVWERCDGISGSGTIGGVRLR